MSQKSSRTCALCDNIIKSNYVVCKAHYNLYILYKNEPWFKELVNFSRRQFQIDNEEIAMTLGDFPKNTKTYVKVTETQINDIINYRKLGLKPDAISKLTGVNKKIVEYYIYKVLKNRVHL